MREPSASPAAICWPLPIPPAASTGRGATSLTTSGHNTIEPTSPQWPPASPPWAMMMSTSASACLRACRAEPHSAATFAARFVDAFDHLPPAGCSSALAISVTFGCRSATPTCGCQVASVQPRSCSIRVGVRGRHTVVGENLLREVQMLLRNHLLEHLGEFLAGQVGVHALVLVRDHDVDAIGMVADVLVDPGALDLELLGVKPTAPSTPKPPALLTATTTSRQWVKAKIGNSMPSSSQRECAWGLLGRARNWNVF